MGCMDGRSSLNITLFISISLVCLGLVDESHGMRDTLRCGRRMLGKRVPELEVSPFRSDDSSMRYLPRWYQVSNLASAVRPQREAYWGRTTSVRSDAGTIFASTRTAAGRASLMVALASQVALKRIGWVLW